MIIVEYRIIVLSHPVRQLRKGIPDAVLHSAHGAPQLPGTAPVALMLHEQQGVLHHIDLPEKAVRVRRGHTVTVLQHSSRIGDLVESNHICGMVPEPDDIAGGIPYQCRHQILFRPPAVPCERIQVLQPGTGVDIIKAVSSFAGVLQHNVILQFHDIVYPQNLGYRHKFRFNFLRRTESLSARSPVAAGDSCQQAQRQKQTHGTAPANPDTTGTLSGPHIRKQSSFHW